MSICPKDFTPCCDDLCHGGGCLRMQGSPMLQVCPVYGGLNELELSQLKCSCDDQDYPEDDDVNN
jgi:hypothetical protein